MDEKAKKTTKKPASGARAARGKTPILDPYTVPTQCPLSAHSVPTTVPTQCPLRICGVFLETTRFENPEENLQFLETHALQENPTNTQWALSGHCSGH